MNVLEAMHTRRSIRRYEERTVPEDLVKKILEAAMTAPSAGNAQPWEYVVIRDRNILSQVPSINPYAAMASRAPLAILVCGCLDRELYPGYWVVDCSASVENMLLAAHGLGLGAVWTGVYPNEDRMEGFTRLFKLPKGIIPHSLVVLGYPVQKASYKNRYEEKRVHFDGW